MFIGVCAQINVCKCICLCICFCNENVIKLIQWVELLRVMIRLFIWLIEPWWCVIKFVLDKYMCGYVAAIFYVRITNCKNVFKLFQNILSVRCEFHAISHKNALSCIPQFGVQSVTVLYPIMCYNGAQLYMNHIYEL